MNRIQKMMYVAKRNLFHSVAQVMNDKIEQEDMLLLGVKNVSQIPSSFIKQLEKTNDYVLHTLDAYAFGGRAIDLQMINPISGKFMTGSSSGTAVNVFLKINDIGIGVDGGGSVLAPAMSLNLYGFISPLLAKEHMQKFLKKSTDGVTFHPSLGFMSRDFDLLIKTIEVFIPASSSNQKPNIIVSENDGNDYPYQASKITFPDVYGDRHTLIPFVQDTIKGCDFMISYEGPVDVEGFGDSVFGHFDERTKEIQRAAKKGLIRVVNMSGATSVVIPDTKLSCAYVLICESIPSKINTMLSYAKKLQTKKDDLSTNYFTNHDLYFAQGYLE